MKKHILRGLAMILCLVMVFTFMPLLNGVNKVYAGTGEEYNVQWVFDSIKDLWDVKYNSNYDSDYVAIAGENVRADRNKILEELGYKDQKEFWGNIYVEWDYKTSKDGTYQMISRSSLEKKLKPCEVPKDAEKGWYLQLCVWNDLSGVYYYSADIPIAPLDKDLLVSKGNEKLVFLTNEIDTSDYDAGPLINTFLIAAHQGKIDVEPEDGIQYYIDVNKDGNMDFTLSENWFDDIDNPYHPHILAWYKTNVVDFGKSKVTIKVNLDDGYASDVLEFGPYYFDQVVITLPGKSIKDAKISLSSTNLVYNGKSQMPTATVKDGTTKLVKGTDYSVSGARKSVGKGTLTITGKGKYRGTRKVTFKVNPKGTSISSISSLYKGFKVVWKKQASQTSGYQVRYANNSKFKSSHTKTVSGATKTSRSVTKLSYKKYWVKVRTYKTVNGTKYYSKWSDVKTVSPRQ